MVRASFGRIDQEAEAMMALRITFLSRVPWAPKCCDWQKRTLATITLNREVMRSGANKQHQWKIHIYRYKRNITESVLEEGKVTGDCDTYCGDREIVEKLD